MPGAGLTNGTCAKALSDRPAFQPYWGKPAVRNDRGDGGNGGIIRSPLRATVLPDRKAARENKEMKFTALLHHLTVDYFVTRIALSTLIIFAAVVMQAQITPSADSYTNTSTLTTNCGAKTLLDVDGATQITYIQFNLARFQARPAALAFSWGTVSPIRRTCSSHFVITPPWTEPSSEGTTWECIDSIRLE